MIKILKKYYYLLRLAKKLYRISVSVGSPFFHDFSDLANTTVKREDFLINLCTNKKVLHFGFIDSPFLEKKILSEELLHIKLKNSAKYIYGVDIDITSVDFYRKVTNDLQNCYLDIQKEIDDNTMFTFVEESYEVIIFSEILEHLLNPYQALKNIYNLCQTNNQTLLCITVPNAFSIEGFRSAISGIELVHPDHLYYFSPYTIQKLLIQHGFKIIDLKLYHSHVSKDSPGITKNGIIIVCKC